MIRVGFDLYHYRAYEAVQKGGMGFYHYDWLVLVDIDHDRWRCGLVVVLYYYSSLNPRNCYCLMMIGKCELKSHEVPDS